MKIRQKFSGKPRTEREVDLGQKDAKREKAQAELERVSEEQLGQTGGGKAAKAALRQKAKIVPNRRPLDHARRHPVLGGIIRLVESPKREERD